MDLPTRPNSSKTFIGLDLSLNGTGVAILRWSPERSWSRPDLYLLKFKTRELVTKTYQATRLLGIVNRLKELGVFSGATMAAVEDYALGISTSETNCIFQLGEVGGCVRYHLLAGGVPFMAVPIGSNKKFATGNGQAKKDQVANRMAELWGMSTSEFVSDDVSDALSLASMAAYKSLGGLPGLKTFRFQASLVEPLEIISAS